MAVGLAIGSHQGHPLAHVRSIWLYDHTVADDGDSRVSLNRYRNVYRVRTRGSSDPLRIGRARQTPEGRECTMHKPIVVAGAVALLVLVGCNAKEKRLEGELSLATARIAELEKTVTQAGMRADSLANTLSQSEAQAKRVSDSLAEAEAKLHEATVKAQRVEARLQTERAANRRTVDSLHQVRMTLEGQVKERETMVQSLETQLTVAQTEADRMRAQKDSLLAFIDDVRPWYDYYKKDSGRNWVKKLFGAGRAKKPTTPEPVFQPRVEPDLEAERP